MSKRESNQAHQQTTYDIYVSNVPKNISENELKKLFMKYGEIKQVLCRWKEDYATIGYAIVKFLFKADADRLLNETNEVDWNGHPLPVKAARRSDHSHSTGHPVVESKSNFFHDANSKPQFMNSAFMKGDFGYFPHSTFTEDQNVHSVPLMLEVLCTNVEDAVTFYGCPVHRFDELSSVIHALQCLSLTQNRIEKKPLFKKVYAALFSEDRSWYRCTVIRNMIPNKPGMCTVRFIDYGNQEDTPYGNVVELPESLQKVPPFASKFVFCNLVCESKSNKQTYLHQLINKRMSLCAVLSPVGSEYQVLKCSCNGKDVISETVKKGFASFKKVQKPVVSKPAVSSSKSKSNVDVVENRKNKTICNGTPEHIPEGQENGISREGSVKKSRKSASASKIKDNINKNEDVNCNEISEDLDFQPKIIIKRGSDLSNIVGSKDTVEVKKEAEPKNQISSITIDSVISNLKLINNIRSLVSQSTDDSIIQSAVKILQSETKSLEMPENFSISVNSAIEMYKETLTKIKQCNDKAMLQDLKLEKDLKQKELQDQLKVFLENFNTSAFTHKKQIQQTITDLASNSNDWMNVELNSVPSTTDELIFEYSKVKDERWNLVHKAREKTNEKHKIFMEVFTALEKEFYLNTLEDDNNSCESSLTIPNAGKRPSYSVKFDEALKELGKAVDEEIHTLTLNKGKNKVSIIQCLLAQLDVQKEKIESICEIYESRLAMYNDLCNIIDLNAHLGDLAITQEEICGSLLRLTHCRDSKVVLTANHHNLSELLRLKGVRFQNDTVTSQDELSSVLRDLHSSLLKEDSLMETLAKASETFLPELNLEHPELNLSEYYQSKFLLKHNWKPEYFLILEKVSNSSYSSKLLDDPVVIKEYKYETKEERNKILQTSIMWNNCRCEFLLKIRALFFKDENIICTVSPLLSSSLLRSPPVPIPSEGERACQMLRQLLICLKELHSMKLVYGVVHPITVLLDNGKIVLDFCFDPRLLEGNKILKGINFPPPSSETSQESGDMYGFGCLVLWLLFPNLSFTSTDEGVPNIAAFKSIIEEALTTKDYAFLCSLVNSKPKKRPSASLLLSKNFLSSYEMYCRSRNRIVNGS